MNVGSTLLQPTRLIGRTVTQKVAVSFLVTGESGPLAMEPDCAGLAAARLRQGRDVPLN